MQEMPKWSKINSSKKLLAERQGYNAKHIKTDILAIDMCAYIAKKLDLLYFSTLLLLEAKQMEY